MKKDKRLVIRVSDDDLGLFNECAELVGVGLSAWGRSGLKGYAKATKEAFGNIPVERGEDVSGDIKKERGQVVVKGVVDEKKNSKTLGEGVPVPVIVPDQKKEGLKKLSKKEMSVIPEKKSGGLTAEKLAEIERQALEKSRGKVVDENAYPYALEDYEAIAKVCGPGITVEDGRFEKAGASVYFGFKGNTYIGSLGEGIRVFLVEFGGEWYGVTAASWAPKMGVVTSTKK